MGMNLLTACHRCKVKVFHFRGREQETMLPFYKNHTACMRMDPKCVETLEDQIQEADWMSDYPDDPNTEQPTLDRINARSSIKSIYDSGRVIDLVNTLPDAEKP